MHGQSSQFERYGRIHTDFKGAAAIDYIQEELHMVRGNGTSIAVCIRSHVTGSASTINLKINVTQQTSS